MDTIKTSEKNNYKLSGDDSCVPIPNSEYEYCYIVYKDPVLYAKGENVSLLESFETRYINSTGELETQIIINYKSQLTNLFSNTSKSFFCYPYYPYYVYSTVSVEDDSYQNIFGEESVLDHDDNSVILKAPGTFKMQKS